MKKLLSILALMICTSIIFTGCLGDEDTNSRKKVAITFSHSSAIWDVYGDSLKKELEQNGFDVDFQFTNSVDEQIMQIGKMIESNPACLVVGAVDRTRLANILEQAKEKNVPVIAYDRLILDSDAISYYVSFDAQAVGAAMGEYIEYALQLKGPMQLTHVTGSLAPPNFPTSAPYYIEVFAGDPNDKNARLYFDGAMQVLQPYFNNGTFVCRSGELTFDKVCEANWDPKEGERRMRRLMQTFYSHGESLNIVLCPNDDAAEFVRNLLKEYNYSGAYPIITGQDAEQKALQAIREGTQSMTIYKPADELAAKTVRMIKAVVEGTQPEINDPKSNDNGKITVPSYLCLPIIIDKNNLDIVK